MIGVINIYKPQGMTSNDVVMRVKRLVGKKEKIGHTGTLDPLAKGVLPICIGRATKLVDEIMNGDKVYKALLKLGVTTTTYDREGGILSQSPIQASTNEVMEVIEKFQGEIYQIPPMFSALKVNGQRLYNLAREGIEIEREPRKIFIHYIKVLSCEIPFVELEVRCSKGTYIRSLCYDIGEALGCGAAMWELERIKSGEFTLENSVALEELTTGNVADYLISPETLLQNYEKLDVNTKFKDLLLNGVNITNSYLVSKLKDNTVYRVYYEECLLGLALMNDGVFKLYKRLI